MEKKKEVLCGIEIWISARFVNVNMHSCFRKENASFSKRKRVQAFEDPGPQNLSFPEKTDTDLQKRVFFEWFQEATFFI